MATLIKTDCTVEDITIPKKNQLEFLQDKVGGMIEIVGIKYKKFIGMIVNEEGKINGLPFNSLATKIYNASNDVIVGDAIIFEDGEID